MSDRLAAGAEGLEFPPVQSPKQARDVIWRVALFSQARRRNPGSLRRTPLGGNVEPEETELPPRLYNEKVGKSRTNWLVHGGVLELGWAVVVQNQNQNFIYCH